MGLGDIVALALGGYVFVGKCALTKYRLARWNGYEMLFGCGIAGVLLLTVTLPMAKFASGALDLWPTDISVWTIAGILGIPVGFALACGVNSWPGMKRRKLRRLRTLAESNSDLIEVLLDDAIRERWFVELALESGKSYVGFPVNTPWPTTPGMADRDVGLIPLFSGDRTGKTRELHLTRYYGDEIVGLMNDTPSSREDLSPHDFRVVIPLRQVVTARLFDIEVYQRLNAGQLQDNAG